MQRSQPTEFAFGPYRIRSDERVLRLDGRRIALAPKVVDTLVVFLSQPDRFVSKAQLIELIWPDGFVDEANLTQNIYVLRKTFAEHNSGVRIENVPKRGYRLVAHDAAQNAAAEHRATNATAARPSATPDAAGQIAASKSATQPVAAQTDLTHFVGTQTDVNRCAAIGTNATQRNVFETDATESVATESCSGETSADAAPPTKFTVTDEPILPAPFATKRRSDRRAFPISIVLGRLVPAITIAGALLLGIGGPEVVPLARNGPGPYRLPRIALQHYLLGRYYLNRGTQRDLGRAISSFTELVRDVPQSALGYAGLADSFTSSTFATSDSAARVRLGARAIALANEAVGRDPESTDAYAALGAVQTSIEHDDAAAARSFDTSLRLDPRNLDALVWYGTDAMNAGRVAQARRLFRRAMSVDPTSPGPVASLAWADFLARDFVDAAAFSEQLLRAHQLESIARITLASSYVEMGDFARAIPAVEALRRYPDTRTQGVALLSQIYALRGSPRIALDTLARLEAHTDPAGIGSWDILALAAAYARLGREDAAFTWLARIRSSERGQISRDPRFGRLLHDRRLRDWLSG